MPTSLDKGRRSPKKLLRAVSARVFGPIRLKRRLWEFASRIPGLSEEQREQALGFVGIDKYALAWEYIADRLIENEAQISS